MLEPNTKLRLVKNLNIKYRLVKKKDGMFTYYVKYYDCEKILELTENDIKEIELLSNANILLHNNDNGKQYWYWCPLFEDIYKNIVKHKRTRFLLHLSVSIKRENNLTYFTFEVNNRKYTTNDVKVIKIIE
jgi:hypothetical protein